MNHFSVKTLLMKAQFNNLDSRCRSLIQKLEQSLERAVSLRHLLWRVLNHYGRKKLWQRNKKSSAPVEEALLSICQIFKLKSINRSEEEISQIFEYRQFSPHSHFH